MNESHHEQTPRERWKIKQLISLPVGRRYDAVYETERRPVAMLALIEKRRAHGRRKVKVHPVVFYEHEFTLAHNIEGYIRIERG